MQTIDSVNLLSGQLHPSMSGHTPGVIYTDPTLQLEITVYISQKVSKLLSVLFILPFVTATKNSKLLHTLHYPRNF